MAKRLDVREVITVVGVVITVSVVGTRLLGRQYPILPFGVAAGLLVFIHLTVRDSIQPLYTLIGVTALSPN